ncbi:MAG: hypothetical protein IID37_00850 [Planctomycetes bacterium]|nr:hypothetical protein [Planctomycetota bacterium]
MKRILALYLPDLSDDRPRHPHVASLEPGTEPRSYDAGDAHAGRTLESSAVQAGRFAPIVHLEGSDTLLLDITGCQRLFKGEANLLHQAVDAFGHQAPAVRGAITDTPGAAWALAHAHAESAVLVPPGEGTAWLTPLPVWALRIDEQTVATLSAVGVEKIETLCHLPRGSLGPRFGDELVQRLEQALGERPELLTPYRPPTVLHSYLRFAPTDRREVIDEAVRRTVEMFCERLGRAALGVRQVLVTFHCTGGQATSGTQIAAGRVTLEFATSRATRSADRLGALIATKLNDLRLPGPVEVVQVWARHTEKLDDWQDELFDTDRRDGADVADLVDRLSARLGADSVVRPQLLSEHQPELAYRYVPFMDGDTDRKPSKRRSTKRSGAAACKTEHAVPRDGTLLAAGERPLQLRSPPLEVRVVALVPEGPPGSIHLDGRAQRIVQCCGPERVETGWWRADHVRRDYYRATTESGVCLWLFRRRDSGRWFLHGWFH